MAFVYMLRGQGGRHYLGATEDLDARLRRHNSGMVHSTRRLGLPLELVAFRGFATMKDALAAERMLKGWKNPEKARHYILGGYSSLDMVGVGPGFESLRAHPKANDFLRLSAGLFQA